MEEFKLSDDAFEQIKDFNHQYLTDEQSLLIDKLILNEELKKCYKVYGLCKECKQPNTGDKCVSHVMVNVFNKISKIGLVEIMKLISLFKKHNLKLNIMNF